MAPFSDEEYEEEEDDFESFSWIDFRFEDTAWYAYQKHVRDQVQALKNDVIIDKKSARIFSAKIREIREDVTALEFKKLEMIRRRIQETDIIEKQVCSLYEMIYDHEIEVLKQHLQRFNGLHHAALHGVIKSIDLDDLKQRINVEDILGKPESKTGGKFLYKCIYHVEDTPSLTWYAHQHNFYCYGCNKHGSGIDLYMQINGVDFNKAISALSRIYSVT